MRRLLAIIIVAALVGCSAIQTGSDPLVVTAERVETVATAMFTATLTANDINRPFWRTNSPDFHAFCTMLRQKQTRLYKGAVVELPSASALVWDLDAIKQAYKQSQTGSNSLQTAISNIQNLTLTAQSWLKFATNR